MKICPACSHEWEDEHGVCPEDGVALVHLDSQASGKAETLVGKLVGGRYRIERVVGKGGMGVVYACRHAVVGRPLAIKVLRSNVERSEEILQRFIREAQAANAIRSRHICEMTDFGQLESGAFYVVMELLEGASLTRVLKRGNLDRDDLLHIFIQVAETLDKAHEAGILHRDLKPDNVVIVEDDDDPLFVKLVDFGIAKMMRGGSGDLTETGVVLGTPFYMSPEQARGEELDQRTDIYSLGVMIYRAFTGQVPFVANTAMGVLTRHITDPPDPPSRVADVDPLVERLILRCMEKKPIDRFQSMREVAEALRAVRAVGAAAADLDATYDEGLGADPRATRDERSGPRPRQEELAMTRDERSLRERRRASEHPAPEAAVPATPSAPPRRREDTPTRVHPRSVPPAAAPPATPPPGAQRPAEPSLGLDPRAALPSAPPPKELTPSIPPPIPPPAAPIEPNLAAASVPPAGDFAAGEALTDRGLVAPRTAAKGTPTWPWIALALVAIAGTVGVSALVFHKAEPPQRPPTSAVPAPKASTVDADPGDDVGDLDDDDPAIAAGAERDDEGSASESDADPVPSASVADPSAVAPSRPPLRTTTGPPTTTLAPPSPPPPPGDYDDGVRSPFD